MLLNFVRAYLDSRDEFYGLPKGFVRSPMDGPMRLFLPPISDIRRSNFVFHINFNIYPDDILLTLSVRLILYCTYRSSISIFLKKKNHSLQQ